MSRTPRTVGTLTADVSDQSCDQPSSRRTGIHWFNPDPTAEVRWGDQTWDEMMAGFVELALASDQDPRTLIKRPPPEETADDQ